MLGGLIVIQLEPEFFNVFRHVMERFRLSVENWSADGLLVVPWGFDGRVLAAAKMTWEGIGYDELSEECTRVGLAEGSDTWLNTYNSLKGRCEETERAAIAGVIMTLFEQVAQNPTH